MGGEAEAGGGGASHSGCRRSREHRASSAARSGLVAIGLSYDSLADGFTNRLE